MPCRICAKFCSPRRKLNQVIKYFVLFTTDFTFYNTKSQSGSLLSLFCACSQRKISNNTKFVKILSSKLTTLNPVPLKFTHFSGHISPFAVVSNSKTAKLAPIIGHSRCENTIKTPRSWIKLAFCLVKYDVPRRVVLGPGLFFPLCVFVCLLYDYLLSSDNMITAIATTNFRLGNFAVIAPCWNNASDWNNQEASMRAPEISHYPIIGVK